MFFSFSSSISVTAGQQYSILLVCLTCGVGYSGSNPYGNGYSGRWSYNEVDSSEDLAFITYASSACIDPLL